MIDAMTNYYAGKYVDYVLSMAYIRALKRKETNLCNNGEESFTKNFGPKM